MKKSSGTLVCPWPECIFRSLLQFLVIPNNAIIDRNSHSLIMLMDGFWTISRILHNRDSKPRAVNHVLEHVMYDTILNFASAACRKFNWPK